MTQADFGSLLRELRIQAGLTQEALAERSGLGIRSIQGLERGESQPRRATMRRLSEALQLSAGQSAAFERAASPSPRRRRPAQSPAGATPSGAPSGPELLDDSTAGRLVGREHELELLRTRLLDALAGRGGVFLLGGEPGIGKTRLAEELAFDAAQHGMLVLWGRCWESEGAPPFWPWIELLRGLLRSRERSTLQRDLSSGASLIAGLVPEIREGLADLAAVPQLDPAEARFRLFDAVTTLFRNVCSSSPVLLVLEDLHWADKPSLLLLEFLLQYAGGERLLLVGTYRDTELSDDHPLLEVLGAARRERAFDSISLHGLGPQAVGALVASWVTHPTPVDATGLVHALWQATDGNPLFVREEIRSLVEDGRWPHDGAATAGLQFGLTPRMRDVITRRLARLSGSTRNLLTIASIIGREFASATLEQACGLEEAELDAALDDAQLARVIEALPRPSTDYRFSHALFREALYADLPARRRMRLHRQVAEALEVVHAHDLDVHVSALAYHYGEAQPLPGNEKFVHYALLAGERALGSNAFEEAATYFQRGLDATAGRPMDEQQAALLSGLGRAQVALLELPRAQEVVANLARAFEYYANSGDVERAVLVAECAVDALPGQLVGGTRLVARALGLVEPESHAAGRLLARYARMLTIEEGDYQGATAAYERAVLIAHREGDVRLEIQALGNGAEADLNYFRWHDGLLKCQRGIELARRHGALHAEMYARFFASIMLWLSGDLDQAGEYAAALLARAEQLRDRRWRVSAWWLTGTIARDRGDWAGARAATDAGLELSQTDPRLLWTRIALEQELGNLLAVKSLVARLLEVVPLSPARPDLAQASTALMLATLPDAAVAADPRAMAEFAAEAILSFPTTTEVVAAVSHASLALAGLKLGDPAVGRHYAALQPLRETIIIYRGMVGDRLLGQLARAMGELDLAARHFDEALRFCRNKGCRPELAWCCYDYADLLLATGSAEHRAHRLLDEALTVSSELAMQPLLELARLTAARA